MHKTDVRVSRCEFPDETNDGTYINKPRFRLRLDSTRGAGNNRLEIFDFSNNHLSAFAVCNGFITPCSFHRATGSRFQYVHRNTLWPKSLDHGRNRNTSDIVSDNGSSHWIDRPSRRRCRRNPAYRNIRTVRICLFFHEISEVRQQFKNVREFPQSCVSTHSNDPTTA